MRLFSATDTKLLRDLWRLRGQALAVGMIVACGVAILVMALSTLNSLKTGQETYYAQYRFAEVFASVRRAPESLVRRLRDIPGVREVDMRIVRYVTLKIEGFEEPANAQLVSIPDAGAPDINKIYLHRGRWPEARRSDEIIASKAFVEAHGFAPGDHVTAIINGRSRNLQIVGVGDSPEFIYTLGPGNLMPDDKRFGVFWMRRMALAAAFDLEGAFNNVSVLLSAGARERDVINEMDNLLDAYGGIGAYGREDQLSHAFIESEMQQLQGVAQIIPPVFLIVSAILLNAILSRLVATERQDIGLMKAFGYANREVAWHYVKLAVALVCVGIFIGFALGGVLGRLMTNLYADTFRFPELTYLSNRTAFLVAAGAAVVAAIAGAMNAALRAAGLTPAEAMTPEPPVVYRRRRSAVSKRRLSLDEPTRMILRHLTRWPLRSGATIFGVAASQALLVGTLFAFDSIDATLEYRFYRTDAYDASINFTDVRERSALQEISRLPGVQTVEPVRNVVARFRNEFRTERANLTGLARDGGLKQLFDMNGDRFNLPSHGIVLSGQLARMIGVGVGDTVAVEILEGRRPVLRLPVTALADESIGFPAYIDIAVLNELLLETNVVTGAHVLMDHRSTDVFSREVLDRPGIASVSLKSAAIESFESSLEETVNIMMTIYALIGGSIAAGVVYNAARITLTERARELASLRVLGFSRLEAAYILVGEMVLLVLLGIIPGCVLGAGFAWSVTQSMSTELFRIPFVIDASTYGASALVVLTAAALASVIVGRRVGELDLIAVLKTRE